MESGYEIGAETQISVPRLRDVLRGRLLLQTPKLAVAGVSRCRRHSVAVRDVRLLDWLQNLVATVTTSMADLVLKWENGCRPRVTARPLPAIS